MIRAAKKSEAGERRASREEGGFSYTKANVFQSGDRLAGMILSYEAATAKS